MDFDSTKKIFPSKHDAELRVLALAFLERKYPGRVMPEHAAWAFEAVCGELDDYLSLKSFLRKVAAKWLWERPSLPRGLGGMRGWREIRPVNIEEDGEE